MKKIKRVLAIIVCFTTLLSIRPVYAAESGALKSPCKHTGVYITGESLKPLQIDAYYHCSRGQEVTKCVQCDAVISRGQIVMGDLEHHHFKGNGIEWECECGATRSYP